MDLTADPTAPDATAELDALAAEYWETYLETHPLFATAIGDQRFDDRLPDPTPEGSAAVRAGTPTCSTASTSSIPRRSRARTRPAC